MCWWKTFIVGLRQGQSGKVVEMAACNQREPNEEPQRFCEEGLLSRLPGGAESAVAWQGMVNADVQMELAWPRAILGAGLSSYGLKDLVKIPLWVLAL